jgi:hypothetical protein
MLPAAFDAHGDSCDIDVAADLGDFRAICAAAGISANRHATSQQPNPLPNTTRQSPVVVSFSHQRN